MTKRQNATVSTVSIDSAGQVQQVQLPGDVLVSVDIEATAQAAFEIGGSADGQTILNTPVEFTGGTDYSDAFRFGDAFLHVVVTDPAGSGETATITIQEARTE